MAETHTHQPASIKTYLLVFGGLLVLTGATVGLSYAGLPHSVGITLAAIIAVLKCTLIALFFMHLKSEHRGFWVLVFVALFFVGALAFTLLPDIGFLS